ncbi:hypothetical protein NKG94_03155 [Micromonospora sp. M12]
MPLGVTAAVVSVGGSLWAWRSLGYSFVDDGNDSSKLLLWTTVDVGALTALGVALTRNAGRPGRLVGGLLLVPGAAVGFRLLPDAAIGEQLFLSALGAVTVLAGRCSVTIFAASTSFGWPPWSRLGRSNAAGSPRTCTTTSLMTSLASRWWHSRRGSSARATP